MRADHGKSQEKRVLVTGGGGFAGRWLVKALIARGDRVWVTGRGQGPPSASFLSDAEWAQAEWVQADVRHSADVESSIERSKPDEIYHLAGISFVPDAEQSPSAAYDVNVVGAARLLTAVAQRQRAGTIAPITLIVGSGTQYGRHEAADMPLTESAKQRPASVYAATKTAQEAMALHLAQVESLRVVCARSFSHSGHGHDRRALMPALVNRVATIPDGDIPIGNDVVRDYLHIDDVVRAYLALASRGSPGEVYNVASGAGISVREIATEALRRAGKSGRVTSDPSLQRTADMPVLIGSSAKLQRDTGWRPTRPWQDILDDLMTHR